VLVDAVRASVTGSQSEALETIAAATAEASGADAVVARLAERDREGMTARAVHAVSPALAAQVAGSRVLPGDVYAEQFGFGHSFAAPIVLAGNVLGSLVALRESAPFSETEQLVVELAAAQLALVLRALAAPAAQPDGFVERSLTLAGDALAAAVDDERMPPRLARLAAEASGAGAVRLWTAEPDGPTLVASFGDSPAAESAALSAARIVLDSHHFLKQERIGGATVLSLRLGEPPVGVLQLVFAEDPDQEAVAGLTAFALRAAETLRALDRSRETASELERTRALLAAVEQATAQLSVRAALAAAMQHAAVRTGVDRVAVYLRQGRGLNPAASRDVSGPHVRVAGRILELALGLHRGRHVVTIPNVAQEPALAAAADAAAEAGIHSALGIPLVAGREVIGLLAVYPRDGEDLPAVDEELLAAVAARLAAAIDNATAHERERMRAAELDRQLAQERETARRVRALFEVSQSFAQSLSLETTLHALARSAVELLGVDAAAIRLPDARRDLLTVRAFAVGDLRSEAAVRPVLTRPQASDALAIQRLLRTRRPHLLNPERARDLGAGHELLAPFLAKGSTAAVIPIATPAEVVATMTIVSFDPGKPIDRHLLDTALSIGAQAALAIDNGRLYQQQKQFADTMQRSLLPLSYPQLPGLEIGEVYESSTRVDVGGDVYDFVELRDGRLAVVLGDVTGHGVEVTADMAMAKFVFRSLAREHPAPGDFLAAANDVVVGEIAAGRFITMVYLTIDAETGEVVAASGGHPPPLLVSGNGSVNALQVGGLALGIEAGQSYEEARSVLEPGGAVVLYTDGVVEARREGEFYGVERLADVVSGSLDFAAGEIARAVIANCRAFAGELTDDCAVVVIKRTALPPPQSAGRAENGL
jgi:serine phosphatase RsbU (regulator of sigma subunit)